MEPKASTVRKVKAAPANKRAPKYPRHNVERALRIPQAIYDQNGGKPATAAEAVKFAGGSALSGAWQLELSSAKKYGFLQSADDGRVEPTERARRAVAPQTDKDRLDSLREAILAAPDISDVYNHYRGESLPDHEFFVNALVNRFKLPPDKVPEFLAIFNEDMQSAQLLLRASKRPTVMVGFGV